LEPAGKPEAFRKRDGKAVPVLTPLSQSTEDAEIAEFIFVVIGVVKVLW
jgi:hypothetical protein